MVRETRYVRIYRKESDDEAAADACQQRWATDALAVLAFSRPSALTDRDANERDGGRSPGPTSLSRPLLRRSLACDGRTARVH